MMLTITSVMIDPNSNLGQKINRVENLFLSERGQQEIANLNIFRNLVIHLSDLDLNNIEDNGIYINAVFSPASQNIVSRDVEAGANIITIDINSLKKINAREGTALILHEIGHALNPTKKGMEGEFIADDYAVDRGYKNEVISSLESFKALLPQEFETESTNSRISRLNPNQL